MIWLSELTVKSKTGALPKSTSSASVNPLPAISIRVPPVVLPLLVLRLVMAGAETLLYVYDP